MKKKTRRIESNSKHFLKALATFNEEVAAYVRHCDSLREMGMGMIETLARYERAGMFPPPETPEPLHIVREGEPTNE